MFPLLLFAFSTSLLLLLATATLCSKQKKAEENNEASAMNPVVTPSATPATTCPTSPKEMSPLKKEESKKDVPQKKEKEVLKEKIDKSREKIEKTEQVSVEKKKEKKALEPEVPIDRSLPMEERLKLMNDRLSMMGREDCHRKFPHEDDDCRCNEYMDKFMEYWNSNLNEPDTLWNLEALWDKRNTKYYLDKETGRMEKEMEENVTQKSVKNGNDGAENEKKEK